MGTILVIFLFCFNIKRYRQKALGTTKQCRNFEHFIPIPGGSVIYFLFDPCLRFYVTYHECAV